MLETDAPVSMATYLDPYPYTKSCFLTHLITKSSRSSKIDLLLFIVEGVFKFVPRYD